MITMLIYTAGKKEEEFLLLRARDCAAYTSEEMWEIYTFSSMKEAEAYLLEEKELDIACLDITGKGAIPIAELFRRKYQNAYLILVSDDRISPVQYMRPTIMASSLIMKPMTGHQVDGVLKEAFMELNRRLDRPTEEMFVLENREGIWRIPYEHIYYFEARQKKVYLNTREKEYGFYGTLDELQKRLPDGFIRTHRGFLVNKKYIVRMLSAAGCVELGGGIRVPVSRTYKNQLKEMMM